MSVRVCVFTVIIVSGLLANSNILYAENTKDKTGIDVRTLGYLKEGEKEKLAENGFVISIPHGKKYRSPDEALDIYHKAKRSHFPIFVTSDIVLHTSHLLFDWSLRFLEAASLHDDVVNLTDAMLTQSLNYHDEIDDDKLKKAAIKNAVFFNIAKALLTQSNLEVMPENVKNIITKELNLIDEHEGIAASPLFGYKEDYSQYVPRGHYSRTEELRKYFKAMMWYGRMGFRLSPLKKRNGNYVPDKEQGLKQTLQAILICKALSETDIKGEKAIDVWKRIYETTSFFAGKSDDLTVQEYLRALDAVYKTSRTRARANKLSSFPDEQELTEFVTHARRLRKPKILSTYVTDVSSRQVPWTIQKQAMKFMGQRFTPDSHIFQNLVYDEVKRYQGEDPKPFTAVYKRGVWFRGFPRGLDVMAVLGSQTAMDILQKDKDTAFAGYDEHFNTLRTQYDSLAGDIWKRDLYWYRLSAARSILQEPVHNVPSFMKSDAWRKKQLNAALGCWTELKHDTIIYTKQPYSMSQMAMASKGGDGTWRRRLPAEVVRGYVEPVPQLYARVRKSVAQLRDKVTSLGFPNDKALHRNYKHFENILKMLEEIADKELSGEKLDESEYVLIENIGSRLAGVIKYPHYTDVTRKFRSSVDNKMPIIADVFTEVNTNQVLEQGLGRPAEIFVIAKVDNTYKVCVGAVYSYYEFKQPMSHRLTDEKWRLILQNAKEAEFEKPEPPEWVRDIAVVHNEH